MIPRPVRRLAFTMLELLVVVAIMTILAAMILVGAKAILGNAERKKTETIVNTVKTGIELTVANKGSAISPAEHPFAGSREPRFPFVRTRQGYPGSVSTTGTALKGVPDPSYLSSDENKLLMNDDRYDDERIVLLYGARRDEIGVLQALRKVVTSYRLLPKPPASAPTQKVLGRDGNVITGGYNNTNLPDTMIPSAPKSPPDGRSQEEDENYGRFIDSKPALDYLFGNSSAQAELASLKALYLADPALPEDVNDFRVPVETRTAGTGAGRFSEPLVYTNLGTGRNKDFTKEESRWKPGFIPLSGTTTMTLDTVSGSKWGRYRLAGLAVYDAWGNELMTVAGANNSYRVISAGGDGALAIDPGKDRKIDTTSITVDSKGVLQLDDKDLDGYKDNLQ